MRDSALMINRCAIRAFTACAIVFCAGCDEDDISSLTAKRETGLPPDSYEMASLAAISYASYEIKKTQARVADLLEARGYSLIALLKGKETDTAGFAARKDDIVLVSFRGTENLRNWFNNLKFLKVEFGNGKVHKGFYRGYTDLEDELNTVIDDAKRIVGSDRKFVLVGHSLGAALAQIFALSLGKAGEEVSTVYLYGSPRVGNACFVQEYNRIKNLGHRTFHFKNKGDPVTVVPKVRYYHTGKKVRLFDVETGEFTIEDIEKSVCKKEEAEERLSLAARKQFDAEYREALAVINGALQAGGSEILPEVMAEAKFARLELTYRHVIATYRRLIAVATLEQPYRASK